MRDRVSVRPITNIWWLGIIQGMLAIFFGATAVFWPGLTLLILVYLFGAFVLGWGLAETISGLMGLGLNIYSWMVLLFGLFGLGIGVYLLRHPEVSFGTFILLVGLTLIFRGVLDLIRAAIDRARLSYRIMFAIIGLLAIAAGIVILTRPVAGGVAFVWALGLYALIFGALSVAVSLAIHNELKSLLGER